jgi:hypothetical protein
MREWLVEIIDQIALGEVLAKSPVSCGQRFGLIAVDNAVEYMLITYVEIYKQLVGGHKLGGIPKPDWDKTKRNFAPLLAYVVTREPGLQTFEVDINRYHEFRNSLYHSGMPLTTSRRQVLRYSKLARDVLAVLFGQSLSPTEWDGILSQVGASLSESDAVLSIKQQVSYEVLDSVVKFTTTAFPTQMEAVALCLYGYSVVTGAPPTKPLLIQSLARSGHPMGADIVNARLSDLKRAGWLRRDEWVPSAKGRKELAKKYLV